MRRHRAASEVKMRSPHLYDALRRFCLGAFAVFHLIRRGSPVRLRGARLVGARSTSTGRSCAFIENRPTGSARARTSRRRDLGDLALEPASRVYDEDRASTARCSSRCSCARRRAAEASTGTTPRSTARTRRLEGLLFGSGHAYGAVAPLVGISVGAPIELGEGSRVRASATGELAALWPESAGLLPRDFGREPDRLCVLELERALAREDEEAPDASGELADAVTAIRLATAAPVAAGPVLFERLDWRPFGIRPVLPIAATPPPGEPTRLDAFRAQVAVKLIPRLALADDDPRLGDALDRWELSLFQDDPFRAEQLRHALDAALGDGDGTWAGAMRAAALLGETAEERADLAGRFRAPTSDLLRRMLVAVLLHGDRAELVRELDRSLLGLHAGRPRVAELRAS